MRRERNCRTTGETPVEPPLVVDVDGSLIAKYVLDRRFVFRERAA